MEPELAEILSRSEKTMQLVHRKMSDFVSDEFFFYKAPVFALLKRFLPQLVV